MIDVEMERFGFLMKRHGLTFARNNFANAMRKNGHSCSNTGAAGVSCTKTTAFGSCGSHYWNCGKNC